MPACDALVVCCPAYLLCVAGVQVRACRVFGRIRRGRVMGVQTQFQATRLLQNPSTSGLVAAETSAQALRT